MPRSRIVAAVAALWLLAGSAAMAAPHRSADAAQRGTTRPNPGRSSFVFAFTGDTLPHPSVTKSAARHGRGDGYDFGPMLAEVSIILDTVDLALCHLEVPLDPDSRQVSGFPSFSAPAELAAALADAGFDGCSTASNHTFDRGLEGAIQTIEVLDAAGLGHAGTATSPEDAAGALYDLGGLVVGHSSYSYAFQKHRVPAEQPWLANRIDADRILEDAAELRRLGAEFVVVSLHWGVEFADKPTGSQRDLAADLLDDPAIDLVVGHHSHVLQPVDVADGKAVLYSLGNFLSNQTEPCCPRESEEGAIVLVRVDRGPGGWQVGDVKHVPTWVDRHAGHIIRPALGSSAEDSRQHRRLRTAAVRAGRMLGADSTGVSVPDAYRWVLTIVPSRWASSAVARHRVERGAARLPSIR